MLDEQIESLVDAEAACGSYSWAGGVRPAVRVLVIDRGARIVMYAHMRMSIPAVETTRVRWGSTSSRPVPTYSSVPTPANDQWRRRTW